MSRPRTALVALLLGLCLGFGVATEARAQSCCGANSTTDFGVVAPHGTAVLATTLSFREGIGNYDSQGTFSGSGEFVDRDVALRLGGGIRMPFYNRLQVHGGIPLSLQHRDLDGDAATRVGVGDASAALRWTALKPTKDGIDFGDPDTFIPLWDIFFGGKVPTGAEPGASRHITQADVFGNGAYELSLGTKVIKSLALSHLIALRFQYDYRFSTARDLGGNATIDFRPGNQLSLQAEYIYTRGLSWTSSLFGNLRMASEAEQDGVLVPDSQERLFNFGGRVTYAFDYPNWDATVAVASDAFWDGGGQNIPFASLSLSLSLRHTFVGAEDHSGHDHSGHGHHGHH